METTKSDLLEENENLAYENKRMGDFLEFLGFTPSEITDFIINGGENEWENAIFYLKNKVAIENVHS
jgi:hypothetical protein